MIFGPAAMSKMIARPALPAAYPEAQAVLALEPLHGTSEQRKRWFLSGFKSGQVSNCNTLSADSL